MKREQKLCEDHPTRVLRSEFEAKDLRSRSLEHELHLLPCEGGQIVRALPRNLGVRGIEAQGLAVIEVEAGDGLIFVIEQTHAHRTQRTGVEIEQQAFAIELHGLGYSAASGVVEVERDEAIHALDVAVDDAVGALLAGFFVAVS